jgi:hypothetical protein
MTSNNYRGSSLNKESYCFSKFKRQNPPLIHIPKFYGDGFFNEKNSYIKMEYIKYSIEEYIETFKSAPAESGRLDLY